MLDLVQLDFVLFLHGMFALGSKLLAFGMTCLGFVSLPLDFVHLESSISSKSFVQTGVLLICLWHGMLGFAAVDLGLRSTFEFLEPSKLHPNRVLAIGLRHVLPGVPSIDTGFHHL